MGKKNKAVAATKANNPGTLSDYNPPQEQAQSVLSHAEQVVAATEVQNYEVRDIGDPMRREWPLQYGHIVQQDIETSSADSAQAHLEERLRRLNSALAAPIYPVNSPPTDLAEVSPLPSPSEISPVDPSQVSLPHSPPPETESNVSSNAGSDLNEPPNITQDSRLESTGDSRGLHTIQSHGVRNTEPTPPSATQGQAFVLHAPPPANASSSQAAIQASLLQPMDNHDCKGTPLIVPESDLVRP